LPGGIGLVGASFAAAELARLLIQRLRPSQVLGHAAAERVQPSEVVAANGVTECAGPFEHARGQYVALLDELSLEVERSQCRARFGVVALSAAAERSLPCDDVLLILFGRLLGVEEDEVIASEAAAAVAGLAEQCPRTRLIARYAFTAVVHDAQ